MNKWRWLFYAVNGLGLGHLTRLTGLARQLQQRSPKSQFLFLTSSEAESLLWQEGFASVKVPSQMACRRSGLNYSTYTCLLHTVVTNAIAAFRPHVLIVDTFPAGSAQELLPVLRWEGRRVFIYREQKSEVCGDKWFQDLLAMYDLILVPHAKGEVELPLSQHVPVEWVGPMLVRSQAEALDRQQARLRLQLPLAGQLLYVGFGGGGDPEYEKLMAWVLSQIECLPQWQFACPRPPLGSISAIATNLANAPNVRQISYYPLAECWNAFDAAIAAAGYNTAAELLHNGIPTIWIPVSRQVDDQVRRAQRIAQSQAGWLVNPYDTEMLRATLLHLDDAAVRSRCAARAKQLVTQNGAAYAADYLLRWLRS
jgi:predicted glycosyltransferase